MKHTFIFDLDGVIVDTAKSHHQAWNMLAESLGFVFPEQESERLKGVSRIDSLEIVLAAGGLTNLDCKRKRELAERKNNLYLELISNLSHKDILPGIPQFLAQIRDEGYLTALGSASRNGERVINCMGLAEWFDVIVDGCSITRAKPDPEVFLIAADRLAVEPKHCVVIEDAQAGVIAAKKGGMGCIGIGSEETLKGADLILEHTALLSVSDYQSLF